MTESNTWEGRENLKNAQEAIEARISARHGRYSKTGIKREHSEGEIYQGDLQQENYLDGQTSNTTRNTREGWKGIGDDGRARNRQEEGR